MDIRQTVSIKQYPAEGLGERIKDPRNTPAAGNVVSPLPKNVKKTAEVWGKGEDLEALVMSALASQDPTPARRIRSMVAYCIEKYRGRG